MTRMLRDVVVASVTAIVVALLFLVGWPDATAQPARPARTHDGKPNLNGIWQAVNTANWNLLGHSAGPGVLPQMGAIGAVPAGLSVVDGNEVPYQPWAAEKQKENFKNRMTLDPEAKCYMPGVPRGMYMPYPFQIVQTPSAILMAFEFASASRRVFLDAKQDAPQDSWMGTSNGRWEGDALVIDSFGFNGQAWLDRSGNFHSEALRVVERITPAGPDHLRYEATIEDPKVFTRPWKVSMPLHRRTEPEMQLLEFKCVEFSEELLYGHLRAEK